MGQIKNENENETVERPISNHPKCQDLVVAYGRWSVTRVESEGALLRTVPKHLLITKEFIAYIFLVTIRAVLGCHLRFPINSEKHSTYSEHGDQTMYQVVAYKRLKVMKNCKAVTSKEVWWSFMRGSNYRALTGKNLVFWINGLLSEVVTYESWSHMEVQL